MLIKSKRMDNLSKKVSDYKNKLVVTHLNAKGYKCDTTINSMRKIKNKLLSEYKTIIIETNNEKISKVGSYYIYESTMKVKIIDTITGKEM